MLSKTAYKLALLIFSKSRKKYIRGLQPPSFRFDDIHYYQSPPLNELRSRGIIHYTNTVDCYPGLSLDPIYYNLSTVEFINKLKSF